MKRAVASTVAVLLLVGVGLLAVPRADADPLNNVYVPMLLTETGGAIPSPTEVPQTLQHTPIETEVAALINTERAAHGLSPLGTNGKLIAAARGHSQDMADQCFFSHVGSDGSTLTTRLLDQGYVYRCCGEIIAAGFSDAQSVVSAWMNSSGHRAIILGDNYTELGVGYVNCSATPYGCYWTVDLASPDAD